MTERGAWLLKAAHDRVEAEEMAKIIPHIPAPALSELTRKKQVCLLEVELEVVSPILGGAARTREIDQVDVIRVPSVRGHLRTWWRALYGHLYSTPQQLLEAEGALWGTTAGTVPRRSSVEVSVKGQEPTDTIDQNPGFNDRGAYATWTARAQADGTPTAPRRLPGTRFTLVLRCPDATVRGLVQNCVRAWILFGGYGGRTRRGLGSLTVRSNRDTWLPRAATREALTQLFERDLFEPGAAPTNLPLLRGAALHVGAPVTNGESAWNIAIDWLKRFRQGAQGASGHRAREPGVPANRPSLSNWPEADKVRRLRRGTWTHAPRHNGTPVWPRAGFGLPIIGRFQTRPRTGTTQYREPDGFELRWSDANGEHDRLASPLVVKALPLADGRFVPCALWLNRVYPEGRVHLRNDTQRSAADFDALLAPGDTALFCALDVASGTPSGQRLRTAFLSWLQQTCSTSVVAP